MCTLINIQPLRPHWEIEYALLRARDPYSYQSLRDVLNKGFNPKLNLESH
jgi:hypothetical protein